MKTVTGIYDSRFEAENAISRLSSNGFMQNDFSIILSEQARERFNTMNTDTKEESDTVENTVGGAAAGGIFAGLLAGLTIASGIAIPGVGLLAAGPIATALAAAGAGAVVGGVAGATTDENWSHDDLKRYESELKQGKAILIVHAPTSEKASLARSILQETGAHTKAA